MDFDGHLKILGKSGEYNPLAGNQSIPLLGIDMWEHAYYLYYMDNNDVWISNWWSIVDWTLIGYWYEEYVSNYLPIPI